MHVTRNKRRRAASHTVGGREPPRRPRTRRDSHTIVAPTRARSRSTNLSIYLSNKPTNKQKYAKTSTRVFVKHTRRTMQGKSYTWGAKSGALTDESGWGSSAPSGGGGWGDDSHASLQELERKAERHQQSIAASQQRMLQMAHNAETTGAATLAELHTQGETIKRIQKDQARACRAHRAPHTQPLTRNLGRGRTRSTPTFRPPTGCCVGWSRGAGPSRTPSAVGGIRKACQEEGVRARRALAARPMRVQRPRAPPSRRRREQEEDELRPSRQARLRRRRRPRLRRTRWGSSQTSCPGSRCRCGDSYSSTRRLVEPRTDPCGHAQPRVRMGIRA